MHRRDCLKSLAALAAAGLTPRPARAARAPDLRLATFTADVTPPLGHPLLGGQLAPARGLDDPLFAHGVALVGAGRPIVLCAIDWCEVRNDAYHAWRAALADAARTTLDRVLVACVHQHDAPLSDLAAQRLLDEAGAGTRLIDPSFHEATVLRVAESLRAGLPAARRVTHVGTGEAEVHEVASNRRVVGPDGTPNFGRYSGANTPQLRDAPAGTIDPLLRTLSFWDGDQPLAALSAFATHPMSYYGQGVISADFVGLARARRQQETPGVAQVYFSGCSGDITAGKYNDGTPEHRARLVERMHDALARAWDSTRRRPIEQVAFRTAEMTLPHRDDEGYRPDELRRQLDDAAAAPFARVLAAMGLSTRQYHGIFGHHVDVPALDFGHAQLVLLPGEAFVAYQLAAQRVRPDAFVMAVGYGECSPGYIPTEEAIGEGFVAEHGSWCWTDTGAEAAIQAALEEVLLPRT